MKTYKLSPMETSAWETESGRKAIREAAQQMADTYGYNYEIVSADGVVLDVAYPTQPIHED